jgi:hypothetical protein
MEGSMLTKLLKVFVYVIYCDLISEQWLDNRKGCCCKSFTNFISHMKLDTLKINVNLQSIWK